jgi:predicted transcriptional regulator
MTLGDKELNSKSTKNRIISYIIKNGSASRKEIAKHLGVTTATLTIATSGLIDAGIVEELGTVGRKKTGDAGCERGSLVCGGGRHYKYSSLYHDS